MTQVKKQWEVKAEKFLVGKKIVSVRYMTEEETEESGFYQSPLVIIFSDGSYIFASKDDEGNDAGALFTSDDELPVIPVI